MPPPICAGAVCPCKCHWLLCYCLQRQWAKLSGDNEKVIGWPAHLFEQFLIVVRSNTVSRHPMHEILCEHLLIVARVSHPRLMSSL